MGPDSNNCKQVIGGKKEFEQFVAPDKSSIGHVPGVSEVQVLGLEEAPRLCRMLH